MIIKEFRIVLPISVEEYQFAYRWSVTEADKNETGGGEGVEWVINEPRENDEHGKHQYTHKIYHLLSKAPSIIRKLAPSGSLQVHGRSFNGYPYCETIITNEYMKDSFLVSIESKHVSDFGKIENIFGLSKDELDKRQVINVDIVNNPIDPRDHTAETDPKKFTFSRDGVARGPLAEDWMEKLKENDSTKPHMCVYKLVKCEFKWFGLQETMEKRIMKFYARLFLNLHRQVYCSMKEWYGVGMDDVLTKEEKTKVELNEMRNIGTVQGMTEK
uniref:phosphatidylinositol transfer protein alpha isoform-like n=1 Tax=Styela clava TaxID=7725 RepID=UPI00193A8234|nr:phosphatidylinositol transfer protein alpha isoform-like [Styela clava]